MVDDSGKDRDDKTGTDNKTGTEEIGNRAVKKAQARNRKKGLPNVYSKNRKIYFEYPDETDGERGSD